MLPQQVTLLETILPRFRRIETPPDLPLVMFCFSGRSLEGKGEMSRAEAEDALESVDFFQSPLIGGLEYLNGPTIPVVLGDNPNVATVVENLGASAGPFFYFWKQGFYGGVAHHFWSTRSDGITKESFGAFRSLATEAGRCLGEWARTPIIDWGTDSDNDGLNTWVSALFHLAGSGLLPVDASTWDGSNTWASPVFSLPWVEQRNLILNLDHTVIPDAIRASCYAIEYLVTIGRRDDCEDSLYSANIAKGKQRRGGTSTEEANTVARRLLKDDLQKYFNGESLNVRALARDIGCAWATANKLPAVQAVRDKLGAGVKPKKPKAVSLTPEVLATTGNQDEALQKLIAEQAADHEPSPLDDDPPGQPRRVRHHKKL